MLRQTSLFCPQKARLEPLVLNQRDSIVRLVPLLWNPGPVRLVPLLLINPYNVRRVPVLCTRIPNYVRLVLLLRNPSAFANSTSAESLFC